MYLSAERIKGKKAGIPQFPNSPIPFTLRGIQSNNVFRY